MDVAEKVNQCVQQLPESTQAEVLDYVEYLLAKAEREQFDWEDSDWSKLSLSLAMRGMKDESDVEYTSDDLKEYFHSSS